MKSFKDPNPNDPTIGDICLLMVPGVTYRALSDAAAARNITVAQLMQRAIDEFLTKTEQQIPKRQLLTERK